MELVNALQRFEDPTPAGDAVREEGIRTVVLLLSPIVPHITHVLWEALGFGTCLVDEPWPSIDETALTSDEIELVIQVNGKLRGHNTVPSDAAKDTIESAALANENAQRYLQDKEVRKVIVVPGKLVNIVVG